MTKNYVLDAEPFAVRTEFGEVEFSITKAVEAESSVLPEDKQPLIDWIQAFIKTVGEGFQDITREKILEHMPADLAEYADFVFKLIQNYL